MQKRRRLRAGVSAGLPFGVLASWRLGGLAGWRLGVLAVGAVGAIGCGSAPPGPANEPRPLEPGSASSDKLGALIQAGVGELGEPKAPHPPHPKDPSHGPLRVAFPPAARKDGGEDFVEAYRRAAPATVMIRTPGSFGTGIILTTDGKILTNKHVVEDAVTQDLTQVVIVRLGHFDEATGSMQLDPHEYAADILAIEPSVDLALVKLQHPPEGLATLSLAGTAPRPGQAVAALGHGGDGLLWAIKPGTVAAIGKLSEATAAIVGAGCGSDQPETAFELCDPELTSQGLESKRAFYDKLNAGIVIQSTCQVGHGDSGGPLVAHDGTLLGVNQLRFATKNGITQYHVGLDSIRAFVEHIPTTPRSAAPDPLTLGPQIVLGDADHDGIPDSLGSFDEDGFASIEFDLDQSSFAGAATAPRVRDVVAKRLFDPELTIVKMGEGRAIFHDTDNDGSFDLLLVASQDSVELAVYRRTGTDAWKADGGATYEAWKRGDFVAEDTKKRFRAGLARRK